MNLKDVLKPKSKEEIINLMDSLSAIDLLLKSSEAGFLPGIKKALKLGADIHYGQDEALRWASGNGHKEIVELLLKNGANIHDYKDEALRLASYNGHKEIVELLLKYGANIHNIKNIRFNNWLHIMVGP